jgi:hypothetical protein
MWTCVFRVIMSVEVSCWNLGLRLYLQVFESPSNGHRILRCSAHLRNVEVEKPIQHERHHRSQHVVRACSPSFSAWYVSSARLPSEALLNWQRKRVRKICHIPCLHSSCTSLNVPAHRDQFVIVQEAQNIIRVQFCDHNWRFLCLWTHLRALVLRNVYPVSVFLVEKPRLRSRS